MEKVLLIEDLPEKEIDITEELNKVGLNNINTVRCYVDAMSLLDKNNYDLLILDMTLPREITKGSDLNTYHGKDILFDLRNMKKFIPSIIITRYTYFGNIKEHGIILSSNFFLENDNYMKEGEEIIETKLDISTYKGLHDLFSLRIPFYAGMINYNPNEENWKENLNKLIHKIKENENEHIGNGRFGQQKSGN